jgi:hypothetical protein
MTLKGTGFSICVRTPLTNSVPQERLKVSLVQISFFRSADCKQPLKQIRYPGVSDQSRRDG